ncbi:MAG: DNA polymerase III subunit epsilon [Oceanococcus sp.]
MSEAEAEVEREIVLDTETTGLAAQDHSIIEVGCLEIINRRITGRTFHRYVNPGRAIDEGAAAVHGITMEKLHDKPRFEGIADELLEFIGDANLVIHNAEFDMGFLQVEYQRCGRSSDWPPAGEVIDSLLLARKKHPNQRNSLDALCKRYEVDNSNRELHGALLDAELLADVYLRLTGGQNALLLTTQEDTGGPQRTAAEVMAAARLQPRLQLANAQEQDIHAAYLQALHEASGDCVWLREDEPLAS